MYGRALADGHRPNFAPLRSPRAHGGGDIASAFGFTQRRRLYDLPDGTIHHSSPADVCVCPDVEQVIFSMAFADAAQIIPGVGAFAGSSPSSCRLARNPGRLNSHSRIRDALVPAGNNVPFALVE
jgi:hypothetical protein